MKSMFKKMLALGLCVKLLIPLSVGSVHAVTVADTTAEPILQVQDVTITEGAPYDLSNDAAASTIMGLNQGTIVVRYESNSVQRYQSLFSVSNNTNGNEYRHFHVYITPDGALGMELRNTDEVFKYTMLTSGAVIPGQENIIAFTADPSTREYKLFANGELVETLTKNENEYVFLNDIEGLNNVSLGATVRGRMGIVYPFGGTIYEAQVYDVPLSDAILMDKTTSSGVSLVRENLDISAGSVHDLTGDSDTEGIFNMQEGTILVRYSSTGTSTIQSLFSVSNNTPGNQDRHFHMYITPGGMLGFELRNTDRDFKYFGSRASAVRSTYLGKPATNTVAIRADASSKTYTLFANGQKITTVNVEDYKFLSDIMGLNKISVGGTMRNNAVGYPFQGAVNLLHVSGKVYTDEYLIDATGNTGYGTLIFSDSDGLKSNYHRIPSLLTLKNGTVVAAIDARFGGTHDSMSNIDTAFSYSTDNGQTWSAPTLPLHFTDYEDQQVDWPTDSVGRNLQIKGSASFIDPVLLQDRESGRLFLFADVMPGGVGTPNAVVGNGYKTIDGKQYLKLRWHKDGSNTYNYSVREDGVIYNDTTNKPTEYTVNKNFELLQNGKALTVKQYRVSITGNTLNEFKTDVDVAMNVFYKDAIFKVLPTTYLGMVYSDDNGRNWSSLQLLNTLKSDSEKVLIACPGVGIQIKNGSYKGRLIVPVYSTNLAGFGVIYSDDGGNNWNYKSADKSKSVFSETQIVEMPDGSLKMFARTSLGYVAERTSIDGGVTWSNATRVDEITTTSYGTQLSVINYSGEIDGKPAIILSSPNSKTGRNTGVIRVGLIHDTGAAGVDRYDIEWKYDFEINGSVGFSYSCLTELPDGNIGIFYEQYDSWARDQLHLKNVIWFETYSMDQLIKTS